MKHQLEDPDEGAAADEAAQRERLREAQERAEETLEKAEELEHEGERLEHERPVDEGGPATDGG